MHQIELLIHSFLREVQKGDYKVPQPLLDKFGDNAKAHLKRQFEREPKDFTLRMSNLGRPLCQLLCEQAGVKGTSDINISRNFFGDITEDYMMFLLHAAGIPIVVEQELVKVKIANTVISGTLDLVTNFNNEEEVWDVKSASDWAFRNKFTKPFEEFLEEDFFGYVDQLFLYGAARGCKVGGWIVKNKSSGEIIVKEAPKEQRSISEQALKRVENKVFALNNQNSRVLDAGSNNSITDNTPTATLTTCKQPVEVEHFRGKPTGRKTLGKACALGPCSYIHHCWPSAELKPKEMSQAKNPPLVWYVND